MDIGEEELKPSRFQRANIFSKIFFYWSLYIFKIQQKERITPEHFDNVPPEFTSEYLVERLERNWTQELNLQDKNGTNKPSMSRAMRKTFLSQGLLLNVIAVIEEVLRLVQPICLGLLVSYFEVDSIMTFETASFYVFLLCLITIFINLIHEPYIFYIALIGTKMKIACCGLIYKKALKLSNAALTKTSSGQINNLMTNDVSIFHNLITRLPYLWIGPMQSIAALFILVFYVGMEWRYVQFGYIFLIGFMLPMFMSFGYIFGIYRRKTVTLTDRRIAKTTEIFAAMRVIKLYAWEKPFTNIVNQLRESEMSAILVTFFLNAINLGIAFMGNRLLEVIFLTIYFLTTDNFSTATVFVISTLMAPVRTVVLRFFPLALKRLSESLVAFDRIEKFMLLEERNTTTEGLKFHQIYNAAQPGVITKNLTGFWKSSATSPTLTNVSIEVENNELLVIIGPVGSGKSTFLQALLQELPFMCGEIKLRGTIAYASQKACILSGTVRGNILFGKQFDEDKYYNILEITTLSSDMKTLPKGDMTIIGERGVTLSGGQKARINLARALYEDADIYLMDDPLSAVDAKVGKTIFDKCIMEYLRGKVRILVTHQVQYLHDADTIVLLKDGTIVRKGKYDEVSCRGVDFMESVTTGDTEVRQSQSESDDDLSMFMVTSRSRKTTQLVHENTPLTGFKQTSEEAHEEARVSHSVYTAYIRAGGDVPLLGLLLVSLVSCQVVLAMSDFWLSHWSNQEECRTSNATCLDEAGPDPYSRIILSNVNSAYVYMGFIGGALMIAILRACVFFYVSLNGSKTLHTEMLDCVIRTPILFFDVNPLGRILNRFTKDMGAMDDMLPFMFFESVEVVFLILSVILINCILNWYLIFSTLLLGVLFVVLRNYGIKTLQNLKRIENIQRSPVFAQVTQTMDSLVTLRACNSQQHFLRNFYIVQDRHSEAWLMYEAVSRVFCVGMCFIINIFMTSTLLGSILGKDFLSAGLAGIILARTAHISQIFQYIFNLSNSTETLMTSVERVLEYTHLKPEAPLNIPETKPSSSWPDDGAITFKHVFLSYSPDGPKVLKNVNLEIFPREKIGIVGRTGAGKSSLITALFRMAELTGTIEIDGINISTIGLHDLRKKVSIIPQDPCLFSTSLRHNLDPFGNYEDHLLWHALDNVKLREFVIGRPHKLDMEVGEGGANFSMGQRQLVCLARAILRKNRILVLDEASANVDKETDVLIQQMIRTQFKSCTVLTVAHRLSTVMDSDRIMVLDAGEVQEFDTPYNLLQRRKSCLKQLMTNLSYNERKRLLQVAKYYKEIRGDADIAS